MADMTARTAIFKGLCRKPYTGDGEMREMKNLCSDAYPYLASKGQAEEYRFKSSVPASAGDGYEADVSVLPTAGAEYEGAVYKLLPTSQGEYIPGEYYYAANGAWTRGVFNSNFIGAMTEKPEGYRTDIYYSTLQQSRAEETYESASYEKEHNGKIIKWLGESGEGFVKGKCYAYSSSSAIVWIPDPYNGENSNSAWKFNRETKADYETYSWFGCGRRYTGETDSEFTYGMYYTPCCRSEGFWQESDYSYIPAAELPSAEGLTNGTQYRYTGAVTPVKGGLYKCEYDYGAAGAVYFFAETEEFSDAVTDVLELPSPTESIAGMIYRYTAETEAGYYVCEKTGEGFQWEKTERPNTVKNITLTEYLNKYYGKFTVSSFEVVHEHFGSLAALVKSTEGDVWLYYREKCYKVPNVSAGGSMKLVSCGDCLIVGECGDYLNTRTGEYIEGSGCFDFAVQCDKYYSLLSGRERVSRITAGTMTVYSQDKKLLEKICEVLNKSELTFKVFTDVHRDETMYTTVKLSEGENAAEVTDASSGRKTSGGNWIEQQLYRLSVKIKNTLMLRDFNGEELRIKSIGYTDSVPWKNRLWSYDGGSLRGSVQAIFDSSGAIDWTTTDGTGMSALRRVLWQGGNVTGITAITSRVIFFKRGYIFTLAGETPSTMYTSGISCPGLHENNRESIAVIEDSVFYLSDTGVYVFSGGFPQKISDGADITGTDACGGTDGVKYYLSLKEADGRYNFYVYDVRKRLWHREDSIHARSFAMIDGRVCYCDADNNKIMVYGSGEGVQWEAVFDYDEGTWQQKKYKKIAVRGDFEDADVLISPDGEDWIPIGHSTGQEEFALIPVQCERLRLKIRGIGRAIIKSIDRIFEVIT